MMMHPYLLEALAEAIRLEREREVRLARWRTSAGARVPLRLWLARGLIGIALSVDRSAGEFAAGARGRAVTQRGGVKEGGVMPKA